jgi:hypothetical protein
MDLNKKMKEARLLVEDARRHPLEIRFGKLGALKDLTLEVYADASFNWVEKGLKSMEGFIILLRGDGDRCSPVAWRSRVIDRACKSAKSAETIALEDGLDMAIGLGRQMVQIITGEVQDIPVPIWGYSDSGSLIESLKSTKQVDEHPMRVHIERLKNHRDKGFVSGYKWVSTHDQLADALTKTKVPVDKLRKVIKTGYLKRLE